MVDQTQHIAVVNEQACSLLDISVAPDELATVTTANAREFFGLGR